MQNKFRYKFLRGQCDLVLSSIFNARLITQINGTSSCLHENTFACANTRQEGRSPHFIRIFESVSKRFFCAQDFLFLAFNAD